MIGSRSCILFSFLLFISSASSATPSDPASNFAEYRGDGLSLEYPEGWAAKAFGDDFAGNLSIKAPDSGACIYLTWMRDPGIAPEKILGQAERTYSGDEMKIQSSLRGTARTHEGYASTLDLQYALGNHGTRKRFAVWNSSLSDRLFFATLSTGNSGNYAENSVVFDHMLKTFSDMPDMKRRTVRLDRRAGTAKGDAWAAVLGDLLASYSYKDAVNLPSRKVHIQTMHSLQPSIQPSNGTYSLSSKEEIMVDPPEAAVARAGAVQNMLHSKGYETKLVQMRGNIWVAVKDAASGKWQSVSLNPSRPGRMIGVLVDDGYEGITYEDVSDLAADNLMGLEDNNSDHGSDPSSKIIRKDCEPSRYVELRQPSSDNRSWMEDLQKALDSHDYEKSYKENVFDCSNASQICWSILQAKGYDARLMMSYKGHPLDPHMWVVVRYPYEAERYVAVEATNTNKNKNLVHLGKIATKDDYSRGIMYNTSAQFSRLHPEEGMWLAPQIKEAARL